MIGPTLALARATFSATTRSRLNTLLALFGLALFTALSFISDASINQDDRIFKDLGLFLASTLTLLTSVGLSASSLHRELERKSAFSILSKPIPRAALLWGKLIGHALTTLTLTALCALTWTLLAWRQGLPREWVMAQGFTLIWLESLITLGIGLLLSSFSTPIITACLTLGATLIGRFSGDLSALYERALRRDDTSLTLELAQSALKLIPDLSLYNATQQALYGGGDPFPASYLWHTGLTALTYSALCALTATVIFKRRDLI
jgi:ABC-type transport system involved in multi-copper enzyme maturation permease subunit